MNLSDLTPDMALAALLGGKVVVQTSATASRTVKVYAENAMPGTGLGDEFIRLRTNGNPRPRTRGSDGFGLWDGNIALEILCKSNSDNTIKRNRNNSLIAQVEELLNRGAASERFFFMLDENNPITPPTPNLNNGYYTTVLNVWWRNR